MQTPSNYRRTIQLRQHLAEFLLALALAATSLALTTSPAAAADFDINTASSTEIEKNLAGVGPKKAEAIVAYREQNGRFKTTDDLLQVAGIGPATVQKNLDVLNLKLGAVPLPGSKANDS